MQQWTAILLLLELFSTVYRRYITPGKKKKCIKRIECKADTARKTFRDTNMTRTDKAGSVTLDSCFSLTEARQRCVAKICNASARSGTEITEVWDSQIS